MRGLDSFSSAFYSKKKQTTATHGHTINLLFYLLLTLLSLPHLFVIAFHQPLPNPC